MEPLANKARQLSLLLRKLSGWQNQERRQVLEILAAANELMPSARFFLGSFPPAVPTVTICLFVQQGTLEKLPKAVKFAAYYIEEVHDDGTGRVVKNKTSGWPTTMPGTVNFDPAHYQFPEPVRRQIAVDRPRPRTWHRRILESDF